MFNPFKKPLPTNLRSSGYGGPWGENYANQMFVANQPDLAQGMSTGEGAGPFVAGDVTLEKFQHDPMMPEYIGVTTREIHPASGLPPVRNIHNDIDYTVGGKIGGPDQIPYFPRGPVTGVSSNWSGKTFDYNRQIVRSYGPVRGTGQDWSQQLAQAYFQSEADAITDQARAASLLSVL